ncbi:bifunctional Delta(1)-pyrroline-2-carboxylate/Delta(1)-piperideine-2-carboxylate reductase [Roseomonas sp. WA12]
MNGADSTRHKLCKPRAVQREEADLLHLDHAAVEALLAWEALAGALDSMFRTGCEAPLRHAHGWEEGAARNSLLLMPAWQAGRYTGVKIVHVAPGHAPAVHAAYLLSDATTGAPLALLDGGALTDRRTAAASVLAARHLARPDSRRLLLLGSGKVAHALAGAYRAAFPIEDIAVWSREFTNAARLAARLRAEGHPARAVGDPDPGEADIVSAATLSRTPLVRGDGVRPGTHVDLVGAFRPDMRESDAALLARATLVVDTRAGALAEAGDVVQAIAEGAFGPDHLAADLAALCRGEHPGRRDDAEVTVFKSVGWAGEDLAAAILAYEGALAADAQD